MKVITVTSGKLGSNKFILFLSAIAMIVCVALLQVSVAFGQEASGSADPVKKFNITFPISTLGNCASLEACKEYCSGIAHKDACEAFAKSKGFYKVSQGQGNARAKLILQKAKEELGCSTEQECKELCSDEANKEKCQEFAKKYQLEGEKKVVNQAVLQKAKAALGCIDEQSCKALCQLEANREKCASFAKQVGLPGGMVKIASGSAKNKAGMDKVRELMEKCKADPSACEANMDQIEVQVLRQGDEFCRTNPDKCKEFIKDLKEASRGGKFRPNSDKAFENADANARFCRENPGKCKDATGSGKLGTKPSDKPKERPQEIKGQGLNGAREGKVQGVSTSPSIMERIFGFLFK